MAAVCPDTVAPLPDPPLTPRGPRGVQDEVGSGFWLTKHLLCDMCLCIDCCPAFPGSSRSLTVCGLRKSRHVGLGQN